MLLHTQMVKADAGYSGCRIVTNNETKYKERHSDIDFMVPLVITIFSVYL